MVTLSSQQLKHGSEIATFSPGPFGQLGPGSVRSVAHANVATPAQTTTKTLIRRTVRSALLKIIVPIAITPSSTPSLVALACVLSLPLLGCGSLVTSGLTEDRALARTFKARTHCDDSATAHIGDIQRYGTRADTFLALCGSDPTLWSCTYYSSPFHGQCHVIGGGPSFVCRRAHGQPSRGWSFVTACAGDAP